MHIDFAPPSNGTFNNSGSIRQLANYLEHEDLERIEKGIYTESFFNLTDDNIYKSKVIKSLIAVHLQNIPSATGHRGQQLLKVLRPAAACLDAVTQKQSSNLIIWS